MHALVYVLYVLYVASSLVRKLGGAWERGYVASTCCTSAVQAIEMSGVHKLALCCHRSVVVYCKRSKIGRWEGLEMKL